VNIDFIRWKFLEFFDTEKILQEDACIYSYNLQTLDGFIFSLYVSVFDEYCIIRLDRKNSPMHAIFEVSLKNVIRIDCDLEKLYFYQAKTPLLRTNREEEECLKEPSFTLIVKPFVMLSMDK
jgi:hypothetical protein